MTLLNRGLNPGLSARTCVTLLVLASVVLLIPVFIAPIPPITDYPNHLARMWLLSGGDALPSVSHLYRLRFDTETNVAIDLIALTIGKISSYEIAGRLSIAAAVLLPPLGGALFWRSIYGRWHWWMLAFGLLAWGQSILTAFLNFEIGIGLALLFAALEPALAERNVAFKVGARMLLGAVLLVAHPFALLFYALLLGGVALGPRITPMVPSYRRVVFSQLLLITISVGVIAILFVVATPSLPGTQEHSGLSTLGVEFREGFKKFSDGVLSQVLRSGMTIRSYDNKVDALTVLVFALPLGLSLAMGRLRVHAGLLLVAVLLLVCFFLFPDYLLGAYAVDARFAVMFPFVLAAAFCPDLPPRPAWGLAAALALVCVGRTAVVGWIWHARQADVTAVAQALQASPPGASILPLEIRPLNRSIAPPGRYMTLGEDSFRHLPTLALIWRRDFVPTIFAARGKQPIEVLPPWTEIADPNGGRLADVHVLDPVTGDTGHLVDGEPVDMNEVRDTWRQYAFYTADWRRFDYALVVNADLPDRFGPFTPPPGLSLVKDTGFARLYKIDHESAAAH